MKYVSAAKSIAAIVLPLILTGCLIVRKLPSTPSVNVHAGSTNTSWDAQEVGGLVSNASYHFRYTIPAVIQEKSATEAVTYYQKDGRDVLTVTALKGTKAQLKERIILDFPQAPAVTTSTTKPWDTYTTGYGTLQVRAFSDGTYGVMMAFIDVPEVTMQQIQDSFEFTTSSSTETVFSNSKYAYSLRHPNNYTTFTTNDDRVEPSTSPIVHFSITPGAWEITVEARLLSTSESFDDLYHRYIASGSPNANEQQFSVHGLKAYVRNDVMFTQRVGLINANSRAFIFTYTDSNRSEDVVQAFDTIMKSFKLL